MLKGFLAMVLGLSMTLVAVTVTTGSVLVLGLTACPAQDDVAALDRFATPVAWEEDERSDIEAPDGDEEDAPPDNDEGVSNVAPTFAMAPLAWEFELQGGGPATSGSQVDAERRQIPRAGDGAHALETRGSRCRSAPTGGPRGSRSPSAKRLFFPRRRSVVSLSSWRLASSVALSLFASSNVARAEWPALGEIYLKARQHAVEVTDAAGTLGVARASMQGARVSTFGNPYLQVIADRGKHTQDIRFEGQFFLPIDVAGQRGARIRETESLIQWKTLGRDEVQARVAGDAVAAYGRALVAHARVLLAERGEQEAKAEADYFAARLTAGDASIVDQSLADAELARWTQLRVEAELMLVRARQELEILVGSGHIDDDPPNSPPDPPNLKIASGDGFVQQVMTRSPVLRSLGFESRYWNQSTERARRDRVPPVSFIAVGGRGDLGEMRLGGGVEWSFPVLRKNQGEIARAGAEQDRTTRVREASARVIEVQATHAHETFTQVLAGLELLDKTGIPAAERVVDATTAAFRAGKVELVRTFIAKRDLATARNRRLDLVATGWQSYGEMVSLTGELP